MSFFRRSQACFFDFVSAFSQPAGHYTPPLTSAVAHRRTAHLATATVQRGQLWNRWPLK